MATKYVDRNLHGDEKVCYRGRVSWFAALHRGIIALVGGFVVINVVPRGNFLAVIALLAMIWGLVDVIAGILFRMSAEYAVTDRRVIGKYGLIRHESVDVLLTSVSGATTSFDFLGRIFGYGSVWVNGSGTRRMLKDLANPKGFESAIHERLEDSRLLKGTAAYTLNVQAVSAPPPSATSTAAPQTADSTLSAAFCGQCGVPAGDGVRFCSSCGAPV